MAPLLKCFSCWGCRKRFPGEGVEMGQRHGCHLLGGLESVRETPVGFPMVGMGIRNQTYSRALYTNYKDSLYYEYIDWTLL